MRHRISIEQQGRTTPGEGTGSHTEDWAPFIEAWASVEPRSGSERFEDEAVAAEITHFVTLRYRAGITAAMRVIHDNRVLEIEVARNVEERGRELVLFCRETVKVNDA